MSVEAIHPFDLPDLTRTRWRIDPARSRVQFVAHTAWGFVMVGGRFVRYDGYLQLSKHPAVELTIDAETVVTENEERDAHLRSAAFFDVENYPEVCYVSESVVCEGERLRVRGSLHAVGKSIPLDLTAMLRRVGTELEVRALAGIDHRRLGMTWNRRGMIRPPTVLSVDGRLVPDEHALAEATDAAGTRHAIGKYPSRWAARTVR